jgi:choline dehydrogenase
MIVGYK